MTVNWWRNWRGGAVWASCAAVLAATMAAQPPNPHLIRFTTAAAFDAEGIAPYAGRHDEVHRHVDASLNEHLAHLQRWVRQPSVSAQNRVF